MLFPAVDRSKAKVLQEEHGKTQGKGKDDPRNLWLSWEGYVDPNSSAAADLSPEDLEKRRRAEKEKRVKLSSNPNYIVSLTRLCVRNLPRDLDDKLLKSMALAAATKLDETCRPNELVQCKIVRSDDRQDSDGLARSKGFGLSSLRHMKPRWAFCVC